METARAKCRRLNAEAEATLASIAEREGMTLKRLTGKYTDDGSVTVSFTFQTAGATEYERTVAERNAVALGLPQDILGRSFLHKGRVFTVTGIVPRRRKYPVSATRDDGKAYKFAPVSIRDKLLPASDENAA